MEVDYFENLRCGDVYCIGPSTYHVCCSFCSQNILYELFPQHFLSEHLSQSEECKLFNKDGKLVKHGEEVDVRVKAEDDPIGYHDNESENMVVDLAQIAMFDIADEGMESDIVSDVSINDEDVCRTVKSKQLHRGVNSKIPDAIEENGNETEGEETLLVPLLRSSRRLRPVSSSSTINATPSPPVPIIKKAPTKKPNNKPATTPINKSPKTPINKPATTPINKPAKTPTNKAAKTPITISKLPIEKTITKLLKSTSSIITKSTLLEKTTNKPAKAPKPPILKKTPTEKPVNKPAKQPTSPTVISEVTTEKNSNRLVNVPTLKLFGGIDVGQESSDWQSDASGRKSPDWQSDFDGSNSPSCQSDSFNRKSPVWKPDSGDRKSPVWKSDSGDRKSPIWKPDSGDLKTPLCQPKSDKEHDKVSEINDSINMADGDDDDDDYNSDDYRDIIFPCSLCKSVYHSQRGLDFHMRTKHKPKPITARPLKGPQEFKCTYCGMIFRYERLLKSHVDKNHIIHKCETCGKTFKQGGDLTRHRVRHTGIKAFKCGECDAAFYTKKELGSHDICHTGHMPHICHVCGKQCRDGGVFKQHMRRHTGERPAKCDVCGKSFYCGHDLNVHAVAHTDARPFVCDICGSTFQRKKALRVHKLLHSDKRKHDCKICGKAFAQSGGLKSHLRIHDAAAVRAATQAAKDAAKTLVTNDNAGKCSIVNDAVAGIQNQLLQVNDAQMNVVMNVAAGRITTMDVTDTMPWTSH